MELLKQRVHAIKPITLGIMGSFAVLLLTYVGISFATNSSTNTTLGITVGTFNFFKDTGASMDSYFSHSANAAESIDIGSYGASLSAIEASSDEDHRFTVSDMLGEAFTITLQSSALTAPGVTDIPASAISYEGTDWLGTGKALTATGTQNTALDVPVTFVARNDDSGLSKYSQEISLVVQIPPAQAPASYTGQLIFTY